MRSLAEELRELRTLKDESEKAGREKKDADAKFKTKQAAVLERMEAEEAESFRTSGYLYTAVTERVKGQVEDRGPYVRWALENDEAIQEFLAAIGVTLHSDEEIAEALYSTLQSLSIVKLKEDGHVMNQQVRSHIDDKQPLPPGLTFRPDPYVSMTKS